MASVVQLCMYLVILGCSVSQSFLYTDIHVCNAYYYYYGGLQFLEVFNSLAAQCYKSIHNSVATVVPLVICRSMWVICLSLAYLDMLCT